MSIAPPQNSPLGARSPQPLPPITTHLISAWTDSKQAHRQSSHPLSAVSDCFPLADLVVWTTARDAHDQARFCICRAPSAQCRGKHVWYPWRLMCILSLPLPLTSPDFYVFSSSRKYRSCLRWQLAEACLSKPPHHPLSSHIILGDPDAHPHIQR
jgi:hypothetical protein